MSKRPRAKVPGVGEWAGYEADLDVRHAHKLMFGKTREEVQGLFGGVHSIERADELLFMPRRAFQYYVLAFADFLASEAARGDSDSASSFLRLLVSREERDPGSVSQIYEQLRDGALQVASNQKHYDADPAIYGAFPDVIDLLDTICQHRPAMR